MVIEVVTFRLRPGADATELAPRDARLQEQFAYLQPGLLRRTTARAEEGGWAVVTLWDSIDDADAAALRAKDDPASAAFWSLADPDSVRTDRYETLD